VIAVCAADLVVLLATTAGGRLSRSQLAALLAGNVLLLGGSALTAARATSRWTRNYQRARRRLARARQNADRLLKVIDNTSAVIYMRDGDGRYLLVNRRYEELFGIKRRDIVGLTDHDLFPGPMADEFRANDLKAFAHGAPVQMEELAPHPDGPHTYITVKYPITDLAGRPYAICGISTDITTLKRAEEQVRQLNTDLERRVRERTAELEASTRELDAFAYSVSHDLRAPLRAVAGFSDLLLEDYHDRLDETGRDYLRRVLAATDHMGRLIDDLLDLSRATRTELTRQPVNLTAMSHRIVAELLGPDPDPASGPAVQIAIDDDLRAVGDPALLGLVLQNLISNAWKFTAKEPQPRIHVGSSEQDGARTFFVRDNGAGFDMRYVGKLFVPFQRLHTFDDFAGSGIGLAIVSRIIARHGGRVWAEGEPGNGAVFSFTLPAFAEPRRATGGAP
jgi:PAS domain S-box-containing protein